MIYESRLSIVGKQLTCSNFGKQWLKLYAFIFQQQLLIENKEEGCLFL